MEFLRGTPTRMELIRGEERPTEDYIEYRVKGVYAGSFDFRGFPLDEHFLTVELEGKQRGTSQLVFESDNEESGLDPKSKVAGWGVKGF